MVKLPICLRCGAPHVPPELADRVRAGERIDVQIVYPSGVAGNVLRWGTGAINVDGCRIATDGESFKRAVAFGPNLHEGWSRPWQQNPEALAAFEARKQVAIEKAETLGRWPANVCHDGSDEVVREFPDLGKSQGGSRGAGGQHGKYSPIGAQSDFEPGYGDSGSAARFFYTAKADAHDRIGSRHPTVKPIDLLQWLVRLVCPKGGLVLDPFAGTGTTAEAAYREGCKVVLIEREEEYQGYIRKRMKLLLSEKIARKQEAAASKPVKRQGLFKFLDKP